MKLKINKYIIFSFIIFGLIIFMSFFQYFKEEFSYEKEYYIIKENCYEKKNVNHKVCNYFNNNDEVLKKYIIENDPNKKINDLDSITLTCSIIENTLFTIFQYISPLIIFIAFIGTLQPFFSSGIIKYYLNRENYRDISKRIFKKMIIVSLITPLSLLFIYLLSIIITKGNFNYTNEVQTISVYEPWKYNNFIIYGIIICISQFLLNMSYCCIALFSLKKSKNSVVSIFMSYIYFIIVDIALYIILYVIIINKTLGFKNLSDYFNIAGYWFCDYGIKSLYYVLISLLLFILLFSLTIMLYRKKEDVISLYENED